MMATSPPFASARSSSVKRNVALESLRTRSPPLGSEFTLLTRADTLETLTTLEVAKHVPCFEPARWQALAGHCECSVHGWQPRPSTQTGVLPLQFGVETTPFEQSFAVSESTQLGVESLHSQRLSVSSQTDVSPEQTVAVPPNARQPCVSVTHWNSDVP